MKPAESSEGAPAKPLRVLYVTHTSASGGANRSLRFLIQGFPPGTLEAHVVCPPGPAVASFEAAGARVIPIPGVSMFLSIAGTPERGLRWLKVFRSLWNLRHGGALRGALRELKPDLVHLNERGMLQAAKIAKREGLPVVMHARSLADRGSKIHMAVSRRYLTRYVDRVIAIDESVRQTLDPALSNVAVVYNPVESPEAGPEAAAPVPDGKVHVAFLSGLLPFKGVRDLIESARLLRERKDIVFDIYGGNPRPDEFFRSLGGRLAVLLGITVDLAKELKTQIEEERLEETVKLRGHVEADRRLFASMDLLVFPSHLNGIGRSVFEAGVLGVPSVVTLKDRLQDIVEDGKTGLIVAEKDPKALSEAIVRLADDRELRLALGRAAKSKYSVQFAPRTVAARVLEIYRSLIKPQNR